MRSALKTEKAGMKLVPYLKDFPFEYYCVIQDIQELPNALGSILVQWFSMVSTSSNM
jgi:midasin (ATPase involved in ribosome maturation)